jgi:two-component system osmolarity sensor histidine kinase EnvZ
MSAFRQVWSDIYATATGLFARTFLLITVLITLSLTAWYYSAKRLEVEPRAHQAATQVQTMVNLTRLGLVHADPVMRVALIKELQEKEGIQVFPREPDDKIQALESNEFNERLQSHSRSLLGKDTTYAATVNTLPGLWVSFPIDGDQYWLLVSRDRVYPESGPTWATLGFAALALSLLGAALITGYINRPLKQLSFAASRIREGEFDLELEEEAGTPEIRDLNRGFNRMARTLEKVEQDRAVMLAGISHDIRTPLTRLRLETEMAVPDQISRQNMIADIEQVNVIIEKFLEYARLTKTKMQPVPVRELIDDMMAEYVDDDHLHLRTKGSVSATVMGDPVELRRALVNLLENAKRYGRSLESNIAEVDVHVRSTSTHIQLEIRDHGQGVAEDVLPNLTKPFFRGDAARTDIKGTGLGLAIVERIIERMEGRFQLSNAQGGGLSAKIDLKRA